MAQLKDLFTKLNTIYKPDVYIVDYMYCIEGPTSSKNTNTNILTIINPEYTALLKELFPDNTVIFIPDLKVAKTGLHVIKFCDDQYDEFDRIISKYLNLYKETENWKTFNFDETALQLLFEKDLSYELFTDDNDIPSVTVSSELFPFVNSENANSIPYNVKLAENQGEVNSLYMMIDTDYFQLYNVINYIET